MIKDKALLTQHNNSHLGTLRDWFWRGWQIRYTYIRAARTAPNPLPIVFLHGFGSALGQWRANLMPLSQHHSIYALDFLGFGGSQKAPARYNTDLWADLTYDFWRSFIGQKAIIVGHSLGALVAVTAATKHPEMAKGLVLLTLPQAQPSQPPAFARAMERIFASGPLLWPLFQFVRRPKFLRSVLKKIYLRPELVDDELVSLFAEPPQDRGALDVFSRLARSRSDPDYSPKSVKEMLPELQVPLLVLWGKEDRIVPLSGFRPLLHLSPNLQLVEIEKAGHCAYDEYPERTNQEVLSWLAKSIN